MHADLFGYDLTLSSAEAAQSWNEMVLAFLAHAARTPEHLGRVLELEPQFAMAHAAKGLFYLMLGRRELNQTAAEALLAAQSALRAQPATARERCYVEALEAWLAGRPTGTVAKMEHILKDHPADSLAMKISQATRFILGDATGMRASVEALLPKYGPDHPAYGYLLGCHAFTLEETGDYARAETAGRQGLALCPDDAWGLHAVAHVFDMTGNSKEGLQWLTGREAAWSHCNNFRYHVWWHMALMQLDQGQHEAALALYDAEIRADRTDDFRDISNATSLLSRLELDGIDIGDRWEELAELSENRTEDGCLIFADLHYLLALIGGNRQDAIDTMMARLHRDARANASEFHARAANPGLSAAAGLEAFGEGDYGRAFLNLGRARQSMQLAGGSHAQRDVFERLTIDAAIRSGYLDEAEAILAERTARRAGRQDRFASARTDIIDRGRSASAAPVSLPAE